MSTRTTAQLRRPFLLLSVLLIAAMLVAACGGGDDDDEGADGGATGTTASGASTASGSPDAGDADDADDAADGGGDLLIVSTTTQIADMARNVVGEWGTVHSILPLNADAHDFEPSPQDVERVADADLVLEHGLGLDAWVDGLIESSGTSAPHVIVTEGVHTHESLADGHDVDHDHEGEGEDDGDDHADDATPGAEGDHADDATAEADEHAEDEHADDEGESEGEGDDHGHDHGDVDPHVWFDVASAEVMVAAIRDALIAADPAGEATYTANADAYLAELDELDSWIHEQIESIPAEQRKMVTNHDAFGYYIEAYDLTYIGAVIPSLDSQAQPTAAETADLLELMEAEDVQVIFAEASINPDLANQLAEELGIEVVDDLYGDSLGEEGSGADTYIGMMRSNTEKIVAALQ